MKISFLEIFFVFWASAILWVAIEYFFHRVNRNSRSKSLFEHYREK
jgi:hypothetical protein